MKEKTGKTLRISMGALSPPLKEQCDAQDFHVEEKHAKLWDKAIQAMVFLRIRGVLTDAEGRRVANRVHKEFIKGVL